MAAVFVYECLGQQEEAIDHLRRALGIAHDIGHRSLEVGVLNSLGQAAHNSADYYHQALAIARQTGSRPEQARAQQGLDKLRPQRGQR